MTAAGNKVEDHTPARASEPASSLRLGRQEAARRARLRPTRSPYSTTSTAGG